MISFGLRRARVCTILASTLGFALALPATAQSTLLVRSDSNGLFVQDKNGLNDSVTILGSSNGFRVINNTVGDIFRFDRRTGCQPVSGDDRSSFCSRNNATVNLRGEGGNNFFDLSDLTVSSNVNYQGGSSDDDVIGHLGPDTLVGGGDSDGLGGLGGADSIFGGSGRDFLSGQTNNDTIEGGSGTDDLDGGTGSDHLEGGIGDDNIFPGVITTETLGSGNDTLLGEDGNDELNGGIGIDSVSGGAGEDEIRSKEPTGFDAAADSVICGSEFDSVVADLLDSVGSACEEVEQSPVGETPHVRMPRRTLGVNDEGVARVRLRCPRRTRGIGCRGRLSLALARNGARRPARTRYRIGAGGSKAVAVQLTGRETRRLRRGMRGILTSVERGKLGEKTTITRPRLR